MLGSALVPQLEASGHEVTATDIDLGSGRVGGVDLQHLDVRIPEQVDNWMDRIRPELVVHLAAHTDLELCERDRDDAWRTNALGTKHVALACRRRGTQLAYISTAGVFDGTKQEPYIEFDAPSPINTYGASKYQGELFVQRLVPESYTVRAGWMVGGGAKDHKFVAKILKQVMDGATTLHAVGDKFGTPTYARDFAECFGRLILSQSYGLYHMASIGACSRFDVTRKIVSLLDRSDIEVVEVTSDFFSVEYFADRPRSETMRNLVLDLQGMNTMRNWEVALEDYLVTDFPEMMR